MCWFKREIVVGYVKILSILVLLDGMKLKFCIVFVMKRYRVKVVLSMIIGKATFEELALGEGGYFFVVIGVE